MAQQILKNNCYGVLAAGIAANTASIPLLDASQWPALAVGDWCLATLIGLNENGQESVWEIVKVTGKLNNTLTVERGQEGIAARAWPAGTVLQMRLTAGSVATPSLVEAVRLALLQMMADDRAQVDGLLGAKVDKNGAKVLSDNNYTNDERVKLANIQALATKNLPDAVLLGRENHTGGFHGFGVMNVMRNSDPLPFDSAPSAFFGKGTFVGFVYGPEVGIPEMSFGIGQVDSHWTDHTGIYGTMRVFEGSRRYTCFATSADTWSPWMETTHRANMHGMQSMDTVSGLGDALDAALRVRVVTPSDMKDFFNFIWNLGSGYYRCDTPGLDIPQYSAGFFSRTADTWTFICAGFSNGVPIVFSGSYPDIASGNWSKFSFGTAASRNSQVTALDTTSGRLMQVGAFGLGGLNILSGANLSSIGQFPDGVSHYYVNSGVNGPHADFYGYLTIEKVDGAYMIQTAKAVGSGVTWKRTFNAGAAGAWLIVLDTQSAVGTIATGSIIESGSNANGSYLKLADGTLECRHTVSLAGHAMSTSAIAVWTYPVEFYAPPSTFAVATAELGTGSQSAVGALNRNGLFLSDRHASKISVSSYAYIEPRPNPVEVVVIAKGRWKA